MAPDLVHRLVCDRHHQNEQLAQSGVQPFFGIDLAVDQPLLDRGKFRIGLPQRAGRIPIQFGYRLFRFFHSRHRRSLSFSLRPVRRCGPQTNILQAVVFFVRHRLAPLVAAALAGYFDRNMAEPRIPFRPVPVLDLRRDANYGPWH